MRGKKDESRNRIVPLDFDFLPTIPTITVSIKKAHTISLNCEMHNLQCLNGPCRFWSQPNQLVASYFFSATRCSAAIFT